MREVSLSFSPFQEQIWPRHPGIPEVLNTSWGSLQHTGQSRPDSVLGLSHFQCKSFEHYSILFPPHSPAAPSGLVNFR